VRPRDRILGGVLALLLTPACATTTFEATPFSSQEVQPDAQTDGADAPDVASAPADESDLNLWPLYYRRGDDLAVLWPLYTAGDAGQSLLPVYEYDRADGYVRVLNAARFRDEAGSGDALYPFYWRGHSNREPIGALFTPLGFRVRSEKLDLVDVLGPVYWSFRDEKGSSTAFLWPALLHTRRADARRTSLLLGLAGEEREGERSASWLFPLYDFEHDADGVSLSLGKGLLGWSHSGDARTLRLLWTRISLG
jgi:hypothetical protein